MDIFRCRRLDIIAIRNTVQNFKIVMKIEIGGPKPVYLIFFGFGSTSLLGSFVIMKLGGRVKYSCRHGCNEVWKFQGTCLNFPRFPKKITKYSIIKIRFGYIAPKPCLRHLGYSESSSETVPRTCLFWLG